MKEAVRLFKMMAAAFACAGLAACLGFGSGLVGDLGGLGRSQQVRADGIRGTVLDVTGELAAVQDQASRTVFMVDVPEKQRGSFQPGMVVDVSGSMRDGILRADSVHASGGSPWPPAKSISESQDRIQHVLFLLQENHSFDNYFGTFPGVDGLPDTTKVEGVAPFHLASPRTGQPPPREGHGADGGRRRSNGQVRYRGAFHRDHGLL